MKTIDTLVEDIMAVVDQKGGWDTTVSSFFAESISTTVDRRLKSPPEERKGTLRMSNLGSPCARKLWYSIHIPEAGEKLEPHTKLKFLYGDMLEDLLIALAQAAGHKVEGMQDEVEIEGIKGHRDCVIDGMVVDVKSASSYSFKKFQTGQLRDNDAFGYISQLSSYVYAAKDDPLVTDKTRGAFLVIDKVSGKVCLDVHNFSGELDNKKEEVKNIKELVNNVGVIPEKGFQDKPEVASGNRKLDIHCSYCSFKFLCWDNLRAYAYSHGPSFLTKVSKEPRTKEITHDYK